MTRQHRPRFIGRDPQYSGVAVEERPEAETRPEPVDVRARSVERQEVAEARRSPPAPSPAPDDAAAPAAHAPDLVRVSLRLRLGREASDHLAALADTTCDDPAELARWLRPGVVADLRARLDRDELPPGGPDHRDGLALRLQFTLHGKHARTARDRLDPLGIGDHVVQRRLKPTMAKLYADRIATLQS